MCVKRIGSASVLLPYDNPYRVPLEILGEFTADFMAERDQPDATEARKSFRSKYPHSQS